ncbi:MAG: nitrate reductase [Gammaproteobacteria bacterium]|nr:nitrate reductase [Gammaproteobacteria bacterium]NNM13466.1 nitrate reductase [Gammaproteobacteria bacterium]
MKHASTIKTTCPYCGVGCGVVVSTVDGHVTVKGDEEHPANFGRLCSKGAALAETIDSQGRLLKPQVNGVTTSWDHAIKYVANGFSEIIKKYGPDSVAVYASGQLLTEDYYVANKFMKGAVGSANIDTNSRLCMASTVVGYKRAFGGDIVPCDYTDLDEANLIILIGSNLAWCHPIIYQRIIQARQQRPELVMVVIDPRRTATCQDAELHLPIKPGTDSILFNGLLVYCEQNDLLDSEYIQSFTDGFEQTLASARQQAPSLPEVAEACGLSQRAVEAFYQLFASQKKTLSLFSQGVNQATVGTDKVNSIINVHLATGRLGKAGMGPFSMTGQPNAMGGREVGGLANQLAAHMDFVPTSRDKVRRFWQSDRLAEQAGLKAVDMFNAVAEGKVKAIWIMSTNPVASMPNAQKVKRALEQCELVVVSDCMAKTDTTACANVLFPAIGWGEKNGTVTNSERRISRQRPFLSAMGEAKPDWWIVTEVARAMGYERLFPYNSAADIFREHAALSGFENARSRAFDISAYEAINDSAYDQLTPFQWPQSKTTRVGVDNDVIQAKRLFSDGDFYTLNRRAQFIPISSSGTAEQTSANYPLSLNTGRVRDQWHTMTRTAKSARLLDHVSESYVNIHPLDAKKYSIEPTGLVEVKSRFNHTHLKAKISDDVQPGEIFIPMHWNAQYTSAGSIDRLVNPHTDTLSGQPEFKFTPVSIKPINIAWSAVILSRETIELKTFDYWSYTPGQNCDLFHISGLNVPENWSVWADRLFNDKNLTISLLKHLDNEQGCFRFIWIQEGRLHTVAYIRLKAAIGNLNWIKPLFAVQILDPSDMQSLLIGESTSGEGGPIVCSCFSVGRNTLINAIVSQQLTTPDAIGQSLRAGTNCGSCIPELRQLIQMNTLEGQA